MKIDKELIGHVAKLARLSLTEKEKNKFTEDFKEILNACKELDKLSTDGVKESFHPVELKNFVREDKEEPCLSQEKALSNTEHKKSNYFKGPRVV